MHDYRRHDIRLRDIDGDELVVSYRTINDGATYTEGRHVSSRLPVECLVLFDDGRLPVDELTAEERAWIQSESAARSNEIDFAGTETGA